MNFQDGQKVSCDAIGITDQCLRALKLHLQIMITKIATIQFWHTDHQIYPGVLPEDLYQKYIVYNKQIIVILQENLQNCVEKMRSYKELMTGGYNIVIEPRPIEELDQKVIDQYNEVVTRIDQYLKRIDGFRCLLKKIQSLGKMHLTDLSMRKIRTLILLYVDYDPEKVCGGWYLFGGFVRDLFTSDDFNDVDIWVSYKNGYDYFKRYLSSGYDSHILEYKRVKHYSFRNIHNKIMITNTKGDFSVILDITSGGSFHELGLDYHCNSLYINSHTHEGFTEYNILPRVSFPEFPFVGEDGRMIYVPPDHGLRSFIEPMEHEKMKRKYFALASPNNLDTWEAKGKLFKGLNDRRDHQVAIDVLRKLLAENRSVNPKLIPFTENIVSAIQNRDAVEMNYGIPMASSARREHMASKGYVIAVHQNK